MDGINLVNLAFGVFNKASRSSKATPIFVPVACVRILYHIDAIGLNPFVEKLKRANHMIIVVTAVIKDNVYVRVLRENSLDNHWVVLASDKDVNRGRFVLLTLWIYVKAND